jgi:ornithine cyclodeaminase/alanine dehydrogenase-like protein (mu-crystallin family)
VLVLSNQDVRELLTMPDCVDALQQAYKDALAGTTVNGHRSDIIAPTAHGDAAYSLKMMGAVMTAFEIGTLRLNSDILSFPFKNGKRRKVKVPAAPGNRWVGLVLLFSTRTGEPLAVFPDGVVQQFRVGATSGLGVRYMAREDAQTAAIIGTGWQATGQAAAVAAVRRIKEIRCFSPNPENRRRFAEDTERLLGIPVVPAESAEQAVRSAEIVLCATNSLSAVVGDVSIQPGMHVGSIRAGELERATLARADRLMIHHPDNMTRDHVVCATGVKYADEIAEVSQDLDLEKLANAPSLSDLVSGKVPGRCAANEITCFLNYHGIAFQFAATGAVLYQKAMQAGRGRQLPTEWFTESVHS